MKICIISLRAYNIVDPKRKEVIHGGTEVQLYTLAKYLATNREHVVTMVVGNFGQKLRETSNGIQFIRSITLIPGASLLHKFFKLFQYYGSLLAAKADVYITSAAGPDTGIILLFCILFRKRFVYRIAHRMDCDGEYARNNGFLGKLYLFGLKHAHYVVSQNNEQQKLLHEIGVDSCVIRNGFFLSSSSVSFEERKYILWVARCEEWKRPELLLHLARVFSEYKFVMIAPEQAHRKELFQEICDRSSTMDNVKFIESVPYVDIQSYFDRARLFIGTSKYEGFPNTYLQACMGATPIVSFEVNPDGFIGTNDVGFCAEKDLENMVSYVRCLMEDRDVWQKKSTNAIKYVAQFHDIDNVGLKWEALLATNK